MDKRYFESNLRIFLYSLSALICILYHFFNIDTQESFPFLFLSLSIFIPWLLFKYVEIKKPFIEGAFYAMIVPITTLHIPFIEMTRWKYGFIDKSIIWYNAFIVLQPILGGLLTYFLCTFGHKK